MAHRRNLLIAVACGLLVVLAPQAGGRNTARAQGVPEIRLGTSNNVGAAIVYLAQDRGYFKRAGVNVDIEPVTNGAAAASAVLSGALDVSEGNTISIALAYEKGLPLRFIAPIANYSTRRPTTVLVVDRSSAIASGADLNGKTLAVNGLNNITQLAAQGWIDAHGGDSHSVHYVEMTFSEMGPALQRHAIDAAVISEPALTQAVNARVLGQCYDAIADRFMVNGWFATQDWIAKHTDAVERFGRALSEAAKWANSAPAETNPILSARTGIPMALMQKMAHSTYATTFDAALIQPQIDIAARYGLLHSRVAARELMSGGGQHN